MLHRSATRLGDVRLSMCVAIALFASTLAARAGAPADPRVRPGATFELEFPAFGPMYHQPESSCRVEVYIPTDWSPDRSIPLLCWFGGGSGTHRAGVVKDISGGVGFVCAGLPYRPWPDTTYNRTKDGGWATKWHHYVPIVAQIERVVGNIDPERRVIMGMSSGGAAIGTMLDQDKTFAEYWYAFGVAGYAFWHRSTSQLKGRPVLIYGGEQDPRTKSWQRDVERYKALGAFPEAIIYKNTGHAMNPKYYPQMRDWLNRKVAARGVPEAMTSMNAYLKARRYPQALPFARKVLERTSEKHEGRAAALEAMKQIAAAGDEEIEKLLSRSPRASDVRDFAATWESCACADRARKEADGLARADLERIDRMAGWQRTRELRTFLDEWQGYPVRDDAVAALEKDAVAALEALERTRPNSRKLKEFAKRWAPTPSSKRALIKLDLIAAKQLASIEKLGSDSTKRSKLKTFIRDFEGTVSARKAHRMLGKLQEGEATRLLERIKLQPKGMQQRLLKSFIEKYAYTSAAEEAQKLLGQLEPGR